MHILCLGLTTIVIVVLDAYIHYTFDLANTLWTFFEKNSFIYLS